MTTKVMNLNTTNNINVWPWTLFLMLDVALEVGKLQEMVGVCSSVQNK